MDLAFSSVASVEPEPAARDRTKLRIFDLGILIDEDVAGELRAFPALGRELPLREPGIHRISEGNNDHRRIAGHVLAGLLQLGIDGGGDGRLGRFNCRSALRVQRVAVRLDGFADGLVVAGKREGRQAGTLRTHGLDEEDMRGLLANRVGKKEGGGIEKSLSHRQDPMAVARVLI